MPPLPPLLNKPSKETGTMNSFKNLKEDKSMLLLLLDSTMDMLMMDISPLLMSKSPKLLMFITKISVKNTKSIKMMMPLKSPVCCTEDTKEIITEEETLGF